MKAFALLSSLFLLATFANGQVYTTTVSNNVSRAEAIRAASQLRVGMWQEDAERVLSTNGLRTGWIRMSDKDSKVVILAADAIRGTNSYRGPITEWERWYPLSDGTQLRLDYRARSIARNGPWPGPWGTNGALLKAVIHSRGDSIVFITLTKAP
jgi:hypothetical protein